MAIGVVVFIGEPVVLHDFAANKGFQWESGKHVKAEKETRYVDHEVVIGKVVEHIAEGLVAEGQVAGKSHDKTCDKGDGGAVVCDA